ncbi:hypothetical protein IC006_0887 [Sulfuracidifex tepidarius]|uniref:Uncharacterized protein n=2 Tax=Sulfuracidifex tepidarius TaxID=1294262 RepID=A0A510DTV8_9CREN|nr:hypothetical protein IC006_0887 [Sulfuracidifex tepidarius]
MVFYFLYMFNGILRREEFRLLLILLFPEFYWASKFFYAISRHLITIQIYFHGSDFGSTGKDGEKSETYFNSLFCIFTINHIL